MSIAFNQHFPEQFQDLIDALAHQHWQVANQLTEQLEDANTRLLLDELWTKFSNGHFGFSVQSQIWQEVGGFIYPNNDRTYSYKAGWESGDSDSFMEARDRYLLSVGRIGLETVEAGLNAPRGYFPFGNGTSLDALIDRFSQVAASPTR